MKIKFEFARGGTLYGELYSDKAPETVKSIKAVLPLQTMVKHTRWCGREIYSGINTASLPQRENKSCVVNKFDITYWRDWGSTQALPGIPDVETISIFYGPENLVCNQGQISVNVIGRINYDLEEEVDKIGERIWLQGTEGVTISAAD
mgnify:CR=1 FL=1